VIQCSSVQVTSK